MLLLPQFCSDLCQILTVGAPSDPPFGLGFFFLAIGQFYEFWQIFSFFNLGFFKMLLLPQFCSDYYQSLKEGAPSGAPLGLWFFGDLSIFRILANFFVL